MKKLFCLAIACLFILGCCRQSPSETDEQHQRTQDEVNGVVNSIIYVKDPRTSLCFAYYWGGMADGGPALTLVPQSSIPTNLLWTAEIQLTK